MKTSSVNNTIINSRNNQYQARKTNFKGGLTDMLVGLDRAMKGSRAIQFTVEDMCGTNFPRSYKGLTAGYKYSHKLNWKAFGQEAIREFLTGPTMCTVPLAIILGCKKALGGTSNIHLDNINNMSGMLAQQVGLKDSKDVVVQFLNDISEDVLKSTTGCRVKSTDVARLGESLSDYVEQLSQTKPNKGAVKSALGNVQSTFEGILKNTMEDYSGVDFLQAAYSKFDSKGLKQKNVLQSTSSSNYFEYVGNFIKDFVSKNADENGKINFDFGAVKNYRNSWLGKRTVIIACMFFITGILMSVIPKLYTAFSGKTNPNAVAIYNEAGKQKTEGGNK